jgi:hypothetical protein
MSIYQDYLMSTPGTDPRRIRPLRAEGNKYAEARRTVIDRWRKTEGWNAGKIYSLIQNTQRLNAQAARVEVDNRDHPGRARR